jgi:hypothetical protein
MIRFCGIGTVLLLTSVLSCGQDAARATQGAGGVTDTGGVTDIGGVTDVGGVTDIGGVTGAGGVSGTGGATDSGPPPVTGGAPRTGGATSRGGTTVGAGGTTGGGFTAKGGSSSAASSGGAGAGGRTRTGRTGGTSTSGGATASGGTSSAGGATGSGGVSTSGGATGTGGVAPPLSACATAPLRTSADTADHGFGTVHYFCSNGGSDSNDGLSSSTPKASWSTIISTFNSMPAGDTVALCRGGSWTGSTVNIYNASCRAENTCDFRDYGSGNLPVINYTDPGSSTGYLFYVTKVGHEEGYRWWNIHVENASGKENDWLFSNDVSDVDFCNIEVHGGHLAIQDQGGSEGQARNNRFTVRNSAFSSLLGQGLLVGSNNFTVDSNVFTNIGDSNNPNCTMFCHAIYFQEEDIGSRSDTNGMETQNLRITNNTITMDSSVACGSTMIHIAGRQNNGLVENNYMSALNVAQNSCEGIGGGGSAYSTASWFRAMTYRRNRIFLLANSAPSQVGITLDGHGTVASDVNGQSVYTLNQAVPPTIVADNIIVVGGAYPGGIIYQANSSAASPPGDVTSGIITYNNSIYFLNAQPGSYGITTAWSKSSGDSYVVQNNAIYSPSSACITNPQGFLAGRSTPNYCRTKSGDTNGLSSDALSAVWTDAAKGDFTLPVGSPLSGTGDPTYFDPYAVAPTQVAWTATDLPETRTAPIDIGAVSSH